MLRHESRSELRLQLKKKRRLVRGDVISVVMIVLTMLQIIIALFQVVR